jgi:trigger factor
VRSTIEPLEGNKVKLSVTFDEAELEPAIDNAWKQIAKEVKIPGFRVGKVPRKVLEQRIEPEYARSEALRDAIPEFYLQAVREHAVDVIDQPEIDITDGETSGDVTFDATVEVRPQITLEGYKDLEITIPSPEPSSTTSCAA